MKKRLLNKKSIIILALIIFFLILIYFHNFGRLMNTILMIRNDSAQMSYEDIENATDFLKSTLLHFFVTFIILLILIGYHLYHAVNKRKIATKELSQIKDEAKEREEMIRQISIQKDEIEALYEEAYAINNELTDSIKTLNATQEELKTQNEKISAMYSISKNINSSLNIETFFKETCRLLKSVLDYDSVGILLPDATETFLQMKYYDGPYTEGLMDKKIYIEGEGVCAYCFREKKPVLLKDINEFKGFIMINKNIKQEMVSPLVYNDQSIGVFVVNSFRFNNFNEDKLEALNSFANIASTALYNAKLYSDLKSNYIITAKALAKAIEAKDLYTKGHCDRVTELSVKTAEYMGFDEKRKNTVRIAAILHDIGKIGVPEEILNKPCKLTQKEYYFVKKHPSIGYDILSDIKYLELEKKIIYQHHERIDGKGYPEGILGKDILIEAKILALADSFDAMTSSRPYRQAMTDSEALDEIQRNLGTQFDSYVGEIFINMIKEEYIYEGNLR